jgi:hypothetical protein
MKISIERIEEFTSRPAEETIASIKASGKVMMSLVRNLYTNPVRAAIRETIQNHLDEHYRLGLDRPIEIHVPTNFDPVWRSRDFGQCMTGEFMLASKGGYMEIGHSTRETDVRQAGAEISACPSRWDAVRLFQDRLKGQSKVMASLYATTIKYQDRALPKGQVGIPKWLTEEEHRVQVRFTTVEAIRSGMLPGAMSKGQLVRNRPIVDPHGEFLIYVQHADDRKLKHSAERLLNDLASRPGSTQVLWIRATQVDPDLQRLLDHYGLPADREWLVNALPLPAGFVAQKNAGGGGGRGATMVRGLQRMHRKTQAIKLPITGPSEIVYLAIGDDAKLWARIGTRSLDTWEIDRLIAAYRRYSADERDVVLLRPKELAKVRGKPGWFEISELMRTWLKANVPDQAILQHSAAYSFVQSDRVARFLMRNETIFAPYTKVNDAIQLCQSIAKPADDDERMKEGAKVFSEFVGLILPAASGPTTATIVDQIEAFKSEYPVLAYVAEHGSCWGAMSHNEQVVLTHYLSLA